MGVWGWEPCQNATVWPITLQYLAMRYAYNQSVALHPRHCKTQIQQSPFRLYPVESMTVSLLVQHPVSVSWESYLGKVMINHIQARCLRTGPKEAMHIVPLSDLNASRVKKERKQNKKQAIDYVFPIYTKIKSKTQGCKWHSFPFSPQTVPQWNLQHKTMKPCLELNYVNF